MAISPSTPPGTSVICIDASDGKYLPSELVEGSIYTIDKIYPARMDGKYCTTLCEIKLPEIWIEPLGRVILGFHLSRFRLLSIPDSLIELFEGKSLDKYKERERVRELEKT